MKELKQESISRVNYIIQLCNSWISDKLRDYPLNLLQSLFCNSFDKILFDRLFKKSIIIFREQ